jgi:hypothetical protein
VLCDASTLEDFARGGFKLISLSRAARRRGPTRLSTPSIRIRT